MDCGCARQAALQQQSANRLFSQFGSGLCYTSQPNWETNYAGRGRGQLREGDLRHAPEAGLLSGRPPNYNGNVAQKIRAFWKYWFCKPDDLERDRGDRDMRLPTDATERKGVPLYSGVMKYFPDALVAVAKLSKKGNDQHNPDKPLHWDRSKSGDELDAMMRHVIDEDWDAVAWRALAHCQKEIERERDKQD